MDVFLEWNNLQIEFCNLSILQKSIYRIIESKAIYKELFL